MADCASYKIDSNVSGLSFAEEECLKQLPASPTWYGLEPNSYSDFGGELSMVARSPIDPTRQRKKGTITDLDASGGFNTDVTQNNLIRLMQGFCFADAREQPTTAPLNLSKLALTGVTGSSKQYKAASGLGIFAAGDILYARGFAFPTNNGIKTVSASAAGTVTVNESVVDEGATTGSLTRVGIKFALGDVTLTYAAGVLTVATTARAVNNIGLIPGQWVFLGGDSASANLGNNVGYARVSSIAANRLVFDQTTFTPVSDDGADTSLEMYIGTVVRNEDSALLIKRRSFQLERTLGNDGAGIQSEYLIGAVANELTINIPTGDKMNADLTFVACDNIQRSGIDGLKPGTRVSALGEEAFNTSSDVYRQRVVIIDPANPSPNALFGYVSDSTIEVNNNVTPNKAVGVLGAFDTSAGNFEVGGSVTAYFTKVAAVQAVRRNADVGFYTIMARNNAGMIFDTPLLSLGGGRLNVEADNPITIPLDTNAAQSKFGHTLLTEFFHYIPTVAMPATVG